MVKYIYSASTIELGACIVSLIGKIHRILPASFRRLLGKVLGKAVPSLRRSLIAEINRQPKMSRDSIHQFFQQPSPMGNAPEQYLGPVGRSKAFRIRENLTRAKAVTPSPHSKNWRLIQRGIDLAPVPMYRESGAKQHRFLGRSS